MLIIRSKAELTDHERNGVQFLFDAFDDLSPEGLAAASSTGLAPPCSQCTQSDVGR